MLADYIFSQNFEHLPVQAVSVLQDLAMEFFPPSVYYAEGPAEIPLRPTNLIFLQNSEDIFEPVKLRLPRNLIGVCTEFATVDERTCFFSELEPGLHLVFQPFFIDEHSFPPLKVTPRR